MIWPANASCTRRRFGFTKTPRSAATDSPICCRSHATPAEDGTVLHFLEGRGKMRGRNAVLWATFRVERANAGEGESSVGRARREGRDRRRAGRRRGAPQVARQGRPDGERRRRRRRG